MGDNKISEAVFGAAQTAFIDGRGNLNDNLRAALEAAFAHLQGEAVPVAWIPLHELELLRKGESYRYNWLPTVWAKDNGGDCVPLFDSPLPSCSPHFLNDVITAAGLLSTGGQSKALAARISDVAYRLMAVNNGK